jgi:hypothetical protein
MTEREHWTIQGAVALILLALWGGLEAGYRIGYQTAKHEDSRTHRVKMSSWRFRLPAPEKQTVEERGQTQSREVNCHE